MLVKHLMSNNKPKLTQIGNNSNPIEIIESTSAIDDQSPTIKKMVEKISFILTRF